jgi:hypothetical protein
MSELVNDAEIVAAIRTVIGSMAMEPADEIGRAKARDALRDAGVPVASVTIRCQDRKVALTLDDGRVVRVWTQMPNEELVLESDDLWIDCTATPAPRPRPRPRPTGGETLSSIIFYSVGPCYMSACAPSDVPIDAIIERANLEHPTGISSRWGMSEDKTFSDGKSTNPCPCNDKPETHQHVLLNC